MNVLTGITFFSSIIWFLWHVFSRPKKGKSVHCHHVVRFSADFMLMEFAIDYFFEAGEEFIMSQFYTPDLLKGCVESFAPTGTVPSMYYDLQTNRGTGN